MQILFLVDNESVLDRLQKIIMEISPGVSFNTPMPAENKIGGKLPLGSTPDLLFIDLNLDDGKCSMLFNRLKTLQNAGSINADPTTASTPEEKRTQQFQQRFISKLGGTIRSLNVKDIAYFYTENKLNYICSREGKRFPVDYNLDQLEQKLDPRDFFRINRQFIIGHHAIEEMKAHTRSRLIVKLSPPNKLDTTVSVERAHDFRKWLSE